MAEANLGLDAPSEYFLVRVTGGLHPSRYVGLRLGFMTRFEDVLDVVLLPADRDPLAEITEREESEG